MSPEAERDSKPHGISYRYGKESAGGRPCIRKGRSDMSTSSSKNLRLCDDQMRTITQDSVCSDLFLSKFNSTLCCRKKTERSKFWPV